MNNYTGNITYKDLLARAHEIKEKAYSPYSNYRVGAALLTKDGRIFVGCNVENAAYGDTICAERSAVCNAVANGCRPGDFEAIAIASSGENFSPCGSCRQVLQEFGSSITVIFEFAGEINTMPLLDLLPKGFPKND